MIGATKNITTLTILLVNIVLFFHNNAVVVTGSFVESSLKSSDTYRLSLLQNQQQYTQHVKANGLCSSQYATTRKLDYLLLKSKDANDDISTTASLSRKSFFNSLVKVAALTTIMAGTSNVITPDRCLAIETGKLQYTDNEIKDIVTKDIIDNQFLATGKLTRSIYKNDASFTDEIDTYTLEQWIKGTQRLFVGDKSIVKLVGDVTVTSSLIQFTFDEILTFNIPFQPSVALTGIVQLQRDVDTGLISSYREFWDQDVWTVIKSAKF